MSNENDVQRIIDSTDIVALVSKYVKLEKQGKNYKGLCPFHNEDTPSFVVSPDKKIAHCFGCQGGGNAINFLMQIENIDFPTALYRLASMNGIEYSGYQEDKKSQVSSKYFKIMQTANNFYKKYLENTKEGLEAKKYLNKRGLDDDTIKMFGIGLAPKVGDTLYQVLKESNYLELDMVDLGLVDKNKDNYYDLFSNRIMFPICDERGNPIGFSARLFNSDDKNQPKYINTRETLLFKKGEVLFNLHLAKSDILKKKRFILHEGQMDVIASYNSGLKEAICTMGTALTASQAKVLQKYANHVIICYDADNAGINASKKAINIFKQFGFTIHLVMLPDGMDPDEFVLKYGVDQYVDYFENNMIDSTQYIFDAAIKNKNLKDSTVLEGVKLEIFELLFNNSSKTEEEDYLKKLASLIGASYDAIYYDYNQYCNTHYKSKPVEYYPEDPNDDFPLPYEPIIEPKPVKKKRWNSKCEIRLFIYARSSKAQAIYIDNILNDRMEALSSNSQRLWVTLINCYYENYEVFDEGIFLKMLDNDDLEYYLEIIEAIRNDTEKYDDNDRNECLVKLKEIKIDMEIKELKNKQKASLDPTERSRIIDKMIELKVEKSQLAKSRRN